MHFAWIDPRQRVHGVVERHQVRVLVAAHHGGFVQGDVLHAAPAFQVVAPRMLHQNAPHQLGRNREEMRAILPLHPLIIHQAHVGFIDQGRRLEAVAGPLTFHIAARQAVLPGTAVLLNAEIVEQPTERLKRRGGRTEFLRASCRRCWKLGLHRGIAFLRNSGLKPQSGRC